MGGTSRELQYRTNIISQRAGGFWIKVSTKETKIMSDSTNDIPIHGTKLGEVTRFKYLAVSLSTHDTGTCTSVVNETYSVGIHELYLFKQYYNADD
ncbi:hypothetical protein DPMN_040483 [Dreissena polymorpha]|uniref:Uncharacterized protein n=1 Tax=Dreissena polymorpha TaxID=45954 RepID=A0A9D4CXT0_DREPO|nr:hypothetical protein DPMN_040483 [Dreissena polymorpha]